MLQAVTETVCLPWSIDDTSDCDRAADLFNLHRNCVVAVLFPFLLRSMHACPGPEALSRQHCQPGAVYLHATTTCTSPCTAVCSYHSSIWCCCARLQNHQAHVVMLAAGALDSRNSLMPFSKVFMSVMASLNSTQVNSTKLPRCFNQQICGLGTTAVTTSCCCN
jgi:hypothetical protein